MRSSKLQSEKGNLTCRKRTPYTCPNEREPNFDEVFGRNYPILHNIGEVNRVLYRTKRPRPTTRQSVRGRRDVVCGKGGIGVSHPVRSLSSCPRRLKNSSSGKLKRGQPLIWIGYATNGLEILPSQIAPWGWFFVISRQNAMLCGT